jgi:hypothetical protein
LLNENLLVCPNSLKISTLLKEHPLKMSEFLENKYFLIDISPSYLFIPEKTAFSKENVPVFSEFLKNKDFVKENLIVLPEYFLKKGLCSKKIL